MPQVRHVRSWEVRQSRSTPEAGKQCWTANGDAGAGRFGMAEGQSVADDGLLSADFDASANARSNSLLLPPR